MAITRRLWTSGDRTYPGEHPFPQSAMNFSHPHFAEPRWLWLALLGPLLLIALQRYSTWMRARQLGQLVAPDFLQELTRSHSPWRRAFKSALLVVSVIGVGLTLA